MSLLTICQAVCVRKNLATPAPSLIVANTGNAMAQKLFYLAQEEGKALARRAAWKALINEKTFTTVALAAQTDALPSDLDWIIPETMFNRTSDQRVNGPLSAQEWQELQATVSTGVYPMFRVRGTSLLMSPTPTAGDTVAYEYVTKNWCQSSGGTAQSAWVADTDTPLLDEELIILGVIWRFMRSIGQDFTADQMIYEGEVRKALLRDGVRPRISTDPVGSDREGADVLAGTRPNAIVTEGGDFIIWD